MLVIPAGAVLEDSDGPYVLVVSRPRRRGQAALDRGRAHDHRVAAVISGLELREQVVSVNAFFWDAERRLQGERARFTPGGRRRGIAMIDAPGGVERSPSPPGDRRRAGARDSGRARAPRLARDVIPDLSDAQIVIVADWMGHPALEVADKITRVLTTLLDGVPGATTCAELRCRAWPTST